VLSADLLHRHGIRLTPEAFAAVVREAVERLPEAGARAAPAEELTAAEADALTRGGFDLRPWPPDRPSPLAITAAAFAALLAASLTVAEAAVLLGVDPSRVRQRLAAGSLYGVKLADGWRLPRFQFDDHRLVPGMARVLPHLDRALHPLTVVRWFAQPSPDLVLGDTPVSPRDWLQSGGDPAVVIAQAADL
jgi:excisionase family DNA binding protein